MAAGWPNWQDSSPTHDSSSCCENCRRFTRASVMRGGRDRASFIGKDNSHALIWSHRSLIRGAKRLDDSGSLPALCRSGQQCAVGGPAHLRSPGIEFDDAMSSLIGADLSAIYQAPHHDWVRSERIRRRSEGRTVISDRLQRDLRMFAQASGQRPFVASETLPPLSSGQRMRYYAFLSLGWLLCALHDGKRLLYEYFPVSRFRAYRRIRIRSHGAPMDVAKSIRNRAISSGSLNAKP